MWYAFIGESHDSQGLGVKSCPQTCDPPGKLQEANKLVGEFAPYHMRTCFQPSMEDPLISPVLFFFFLFFLLFLLLFYAQYKLKINIMINFVGCDISKADFYAAFEENGEALRFTNDREGVESFIKHLREIVFKKKDTVIGMESTGFYHILLALLCKNEGYEVRIINPLITSKQNKVNIRRVKTDPKDARLIRYCTVKGEGYPFLETEDTLKIKALVRQRDYMARLKAQLNLKHQALSHREECIQGPITQINLELHEMISLKMKELDKELTECDKPLQKLLRSIPGVGPQTAITLISEVGNIHRFPDSKKLTAFIGLDSRTHQSGTSILGKGFITKRGNKLLRTRLFNAASSAVQHSNLFQDFFVKKRSEGKHYMVALVATMHKMVHVIHAVWKRQTPFVQEKK